MTISADRPRLPFPRPNVLDLAPVYEVLRREAPITPVTTPAGDPAWLVTSYREVRELLTDKRFGRSHPDPEHAAKITTAAILGGPMSDYDTEEQQHARMRRLLTPAFSAKRMRLLSGYVQELTDGYIEDLVAARAAAPGGVVDLHARLAVPLPIAVICKLLGVPEEDRTDFRSLSDRIATASADGDAKRAWEEFGLYMVGLIEAKRAEGLGEDVISDLIRAQADDETYDYEEMVFMCVGLLFAGHETTVNRIGLGTLFLLTKPERYEALVADPDGLLDPTIEEIMRLGAPGDLGIPRYAKEDVDICGVTIKAGDAVILSLNAANRDERAFTDPESFTPERPERGHVSFGHGAHFCIGASLARTELRVVFGTLARRLPGLRLAAELDDLEVKVDHLTGGVTSLPVTW